MVDYFKMQQVAHLYKITNQLTGQYYIGKHNGWKQNGYWGSGLRLKYNQQKYGIENYTYEILCYSTPEYILKLEEKMVTINLIESDNLCLNLMAGGYGSTSITEDTRKKLSAAKKGHEMYSRKDRNEKIKNSLTGSKLSEERKEKIRLKAIGKKQSAETKLKKNESISKLIWIHNGTVNRRILPNLLEEYKNNGFVRGQINKKGKSNG
jgi:hypothetical protein